MQPLAPRISIECDGIEVMQEELSSPSEKQQLQHTSPSSSASSSRDSSLEGTASDAFAILLQRHGSALSASTSATTTPSVDDDSTHTSRARSHSDSVTLTPSWQQHYRPLPLAQLPPPPKSFSSSCRRSAPVPALILPLAGASPSKKSAEAVHPSTSLTLAAPSTPLTALSVGEQSPGILTPGLIQLRRAFPLPPSTRVTQEQDLNRTPTLASKMEQEQSHFAAYRLPGAFDSLDSLDTVQFSMRDSSRGNISERNSSCHPASHTYTTPSTPTHITADSSLIHRSSRSSLSPGSTSTSSPHNHRRTRSRRALKNKHSKASLRSVHSRGDSEYDITCMPGGIDYDFMSTPPTKYNHAPSQHNITTTTTKDGGRTSRSSWRSRYSASRPDTAMSVLTTTETVYEDAVDHFSGDEADAEEDAEDLVPGNVLASHLGISTSSSSSSISTVTGPSNSNINGARKSRFRLSFQRRKAGGATSPLDNAFFSSTSVYRPASSLSVQSSSHSHALLGWSGGVGGGKRMSGASPELTRRGSTPSSSSPENTFLTNGLVSSSSTRPLSSSSARAAREDVREHYRDGSSPSTMFTTEEALSMHRPTSASSAPVSALRPLMLTPEKTRRGSLKDWSTLLPSTMHGSQFIEEFGKEEEDADDHTNFATDLRKDAKMIMKEMNADGVEERCEGEDDGNPYAQIYEELAKSPELESEDTLSPMTPLFHDVTQEQHIPLPLTGMAGLKITNMLEPVVEESFIESDGDNHGHSVIDEPHAAADDGDDTVEPEQINTSTTSISVVAITTDVPLSAGRQSTESRHKRASRPTSLANNNSYDPRTRTSSVASSALSRPTYTSSTNATLKSVENATVEQGHRLSAQALRTERFEMKSPIRDELGYERDLLDFFKEEEEPATFRQQLRQKSRSGSLPPEALQNDERHDQNTKIQPLPDKSANIRQRTKSQPAKLQHHKKGKVIVRGEEDRYSEIVQDFLPLDARLRKQVKAGNGNGHNKIGKKFSTANQSQNSDKHISSFFLGALKKRKSMGDVRVDAGISWKSAVAQLPTLSIRNKIISAPSHAKHISTGALNPNHNRESPFGRRSTSPVRGYITVPTGEIGLAIKASHPLFLDHEREGSRSSTSLGLSPSTMGNDSPSSRSSPSPTGTSETFASPTFFSSPLSSTSSHSEEGPSTPRVLSPCISGSRLGSRKVYNDRQGTQGGERPADFWAVSFAEAQACEGDFVAPHATLVKGSKLAMLSTNEKARRRASKASLKS